MTLDLKTKLIQEAQERFHEYLKENLDLKFDLSKIICGGTNVCYEHAMVIEEIGQSIVKNISKDFLATEIGNAVEKTCNHCYCKKEDVFTAEVNTDREEPKNWKKHLICCNCGHKSLSTLTQTKGEDK